MLWGAYPASPRSFRTVEMLSPPTTPHGVGHANVVVVKLRLIYVDLVHGMFRYLLRHVNAIKCGYLQASGILPPVGALTIVLPMGIL